MLIIKINGKKNFEKSLKDFKNKFVKTKMIEILFKKKEFQKKSDIRRKKIQKSIFLIKNRKIDL